MHLQMVDFPLSCWFSGRVFVVLGAYESTYFNRNFSTHEPSISIIPRKPENSPVLAVHILVKTRWWFQILAIFTPFPGEMI